MDLRTLELKIARSENLPVLPQIVSAVLKLADDPEAGPKTMEGVVERDPAIAAKILRVASSPFYGVGQITSLNRAISLLGMATIRSQVISVAYQQVIAGRSQSQLFDRIAFWRHNLATAVCARIIGKLRDPVHAEEHYACGMMHDVGLLVMDKFCPYQLDSAIKLAKEQNMPLHVAEATLLGFDHCEIGAILAQKWGLSCTMQHAIRYHHEPLSDPEYGQHSAYVALANHLAARSGFYSYGAAMGDEPDPSVLDLVKIEPEQFAAIEKVMTAEIERAEQTYQMR